MRSTKVIINKNNLINNYNIIRSILKNKKILAVVKGNAYGHGSIECSKILDKEGADMFGVAFCNEGIALREAGVNKPILIMAPPSIEEAQEVCIHQFHTVVSSLELATEISKTAKSVGVVANLHLYVDCGMHRDGVYPEDVLEFAEKAKNLPNIKIVGICAHLSTSEREDKTIANSQISRFKFALNSLKNAGFELEYIHIENTGGIANFNDPEFTMARAGISLYGYTPADSLSNLKDIKPVLSLKSNILLIRRIKAGDYVSYGTMWRAEKDCNIATAPIGYADGYSRALNGKAEVLIKGKRYKVVGSIYMDEIMIDLGDDDLKIGEEIVLIGKQANETISAMEIADKISTIVWEPLAAISARVPRIVE